MKNSVFVLAIIFSTVSCAYNVERSFEGFNKEYSIQDLSRERAEAQADRLFNQDLEAYSRIKKEKEEKDRSRREYEAGKIKEENKLRSDFKKEMSDKTCLKDKWSRYTYGEYYYSLALKYKITPYEVVYGDSYTQRNMSSLLRLEALENVSKYSAFHFSKAERFVYDNSNKEQKKSIFNRIVKKDYDCYIKLK